MPLKYFRIDGIATFVRHVGATTLPEKPPDLSLGATVVCLHHSGGNSGNFARVLDTLGDSHSPIALDFPGHDRSGSLDSLGSIEAMASFVALFCEKLALPKAVFIGQEMGAAVALELALTHPDKVKGLVLCGGAVDFPFDDDMLTRARLVTEGKARREFDTALFAKGTTPDVFRAGYMDSLKTDPRVVYPNLLACRDWKRADRLREFDVPALLCAGEEAAGERAEAATALAGALPNARAIAIPGAAHMLPLEQPEALAAAIDSFAKELS